MQRMKNLLMGSILALGLFAANGGYAAADGTAGQLVVSVDGGQRPLRDVLTEISKQTSWTVSVDEKLIDKPIAGNFQEIGLESFLKRSLKGENLIVLYDESAKSVEIRSFGGPSVMLTIKAEVPMPNMMDQKALKALKDKEQKIYAKYMANPDSIEPITGMKLGEIKALRDREQKIYEDYISKPESVDPMTKMTIGGYDALHASEKKNYEKYVSDPESIEPVTGLKLGEIKALQAKEKTIYDSYVANPESVDPVTNMTAGQMAALRDKK